MDFGGLAGRIGKLVADNSALVLSAMAVTGTLATAYLTGKASYEAAEVIKKESAEKYVESQKNISEPVKSDKSWEERVAESFTFRDRIECTWELYIPAASTATLTIACIILANRIGTRRAALMAAAYKTLDEGYGEYREKMKERLGERKEKAVRDEIQQDHVRNDPPIREKIILTGNGEVLCRDDFSGRYFKSTVHTIQKAVNDLNHRVIHDNYASLGDFYDMINLERTAYSEEVGWTSERLLELSESTAMTDDGTPCYVFGFAVEPIRNYYRIY